MPSFAYPWLLLLLPLVPLACRWYWRRPLPALRFSDARLFANLPVGRAPLIRRLELLLFGAAAICLVLALAGPRRELPTPVATEGIAIMLVVDVSGSMHEPDFDAQGKPTTRLEAVRRAFQLFVLGGQGPTGQAFAGRPNDLIGLVTFASYPDTAAPLTLSHGVLVRLLAQEPLRKPDEGQTNIGDAIAEALARLDAAGARRKVMILLTDGEHNFTGPATAPTMKPRPAAQRARDLGVPIYAIDAGSDAPEIDASVRIAARESLKDVASVSGGEYFSARDADGLARICETIDRLERRPIQSFRYRRYREDHLPFGLVAFAMLVASRLLSFTLGRRLP